jgi:hypothetical protein
MLLLVHFFVAKANTGDAAKKLLLTCQARLNDILLEEDQASDPKSIENCKNLLQELDRIISNLSDCPLEETYQSFTKKMLDLMFKIKEQHLNRKKDESYVTIKSTTEMLISERISPFNNNPFTPPIDDRILGFMFF